MTQLRVLDYHVCPDLQLLCCLSRRKRPERDGKDRVEIAFRRLDINGDGYIDWTEFQKVCSL